MNTYFETLVEDFFKNKSDGKGTRPVNILKSDKTGYSNLANEDQKRQVEEFKGWLNKSDKYDLNVTGVVTQIVRVTHRP